MAEIPMPEKEVMEEDILGIYLEVKTAVKKNLFIENISNFTNVLTDFFSGPIGSTSEIRKLKITGEKENVTRTLNLIVKTLTNDETRRENFGLLEMFKLELHMYNKVFPAYEKLLAENSLKPLEIYPRFYHTFHKTIIMEDIQSSGFKQSEEVIMDNDHLELAILECSRFHALGFALKEKRTSQFEKIAQRSNLYFEIYRNNFKEDVYNLCRKSLSILDSSTDMKVIHRFGTCVADLDVFFESLTSHLDDKYSTIIHGDLKWHNMMFKYDDPDQPMKPTEVCFFDFQVAALGPPVLDLIILLYTNLKAEKYEELDQYLIMYHESLSKHLEKFNCNSSKLYPLEVLKKQWKAFAKFGLIINQDIAQFESIKKNNSIEDMKAEEGPKDKDSDFEFSFICKPKGNIEIYKDIVNPLILHLVKNEFI